MFLESLAQDVRYACRGARRAPLFAVTVAGTIGLGLGVLCSWFTIVNAYLFKAVRLPEPTALHGLSWDSAVSERHALTCAEFEALAAEVKKPGEGVQGVEADVSTVRAEPGERPAAGAGVLLRTTVEIEHVDTSFNTVSFRRSDGQSRTVAVESPEGRKFIRGLRKGDQVEIAYTEAFAIEVKPAG